MASLHSTSDASIDSITSYDGPPCHCCKATIMTMAWTDENPGRRFFKCDDHGFVVWADKEKPCVWQKQSLLEARDKIRTQTQEIKALRDKIRQANGLIAALEISRSAVPVNDQLKAIEDLIRAQNMEREVILRKLVLFSCGGLAAASAVIFYILKK